MASMRRALDLDMDNLTDLIYRLYNLKFHPFEGWKLRVAPDVVPFRDLILSPISGKTTEECFTFFMGRKTRDASQWMMSLKRSYSWFKKRLVYQGSKGVDDPMAFKNMDIPNSSVDRLDAPRSFLN
ncbi:hypothetical protein GBA52_003602 [Prunus armeniaca]|nr:hypothetical protein GBA52_003602 [Prunus armeniaca]